jgi:EAL domain-containing protein (putative c-di-GMP-specific phosphodiesterase class I)
MDAHPAASQGFKLSIDDFGTGYSRWCSSKGAILEIKVDLSFVTQMMRNDGCRVIVEIIIDWRAARLKMPPRVSKTPRRWP